MGYNDAVRRVKGKVHVVYSDAEISKDIEITTNDDSAISHKEEVILQYDTPEIKACTMDGLATMDGTYQMQDFELVQGWWSNTLSGQNGEFIEPYPWLKAEFVPRPIISWIISGDNKLGQYPVDYDLIIYNQADAELARIEIRNNTEMIKEIVLVNPVAQATKIQMILKKWSHGRTKAKILNFFNVVEEIYEGLDLKEFEVLEEIGTGAEIKFGIKSGTTSITILNTDRKFDRGYLKDLAVLDRKVIPYIGIEDNGKVSYTRLGTFYSDEWDVPQNSQWVKAKCVDKLMRLQDKTYNGYPLTENATLYEMAVDVLESVGYTKELYSIDKELKDMVVPKAFLEKQSVWEALESIAIAGMSNIYIARDDTLVIEKEDAVYDIGEYEIKPNRLFDYRRNSKLTNFANLVEVKYTDVQIDEAESDAYEGIHVIDANGELAISVEYSINIADAVLDISPSVGIEIVSFSSGINAGAFVLKNNKADLVVLNIKIKGRRVRLSKQTVTIKDEESIRKYGVQDYKCGESELIQTYEQAEFIGEYVLERLKVMNTSLVIKWRGDPLLETNNIFTCQDRFGDTAKYINKYNRYLYDGGLKQDTKATRIKEGVNVKLDRTKN